MSWCEIEFESGQEGMAGGNRPLPPRGGPSSLTTGMEFFVNGLEPLAVDMGVDLGGGNVGVA